MTGALDDFDELPDREIAEGLYYRMVDEDGRVIMQTGRRIEVGDQYLDGDNQLYEVVRVENRVGRVRHLETVASGPQFSFSSENRRQAVSGLVPVQAQFDRRIAIYHTHNGESYVPTRGKPHVVGRGDIHIVGDVFQEALEEQGVEVIHAEDIHLPHDRGAYRRSRDTVVRLLAKDPDALFDVHRDAAPPEAYAEKVDGEWLTQVMFVVGRQNPHFEVNRSFAFDLKNYINGVFPGLIRGVFMANGNYNQDLYPLSLLLEVGAHKNSLCAAEKGMALFAEGLNLYLYGPVPEQPELAPVQEPGRQAPVWRNIVLVLLVVGVVGGGFYWLNNPQAADRFGRRARSRVGELSVRVRRYFDQRRRR